MASLLSVRDLTVGFATDQGMVRVLDRVNLAIEPGEVVGLVGESGCGKTTLARTILGILPASARIGGGAIDFKGTDLLGMAPARLNDEVRGRRITFIPQDPYGSFNPVFTVGTQVMELMRWKSPLRADGDGRWPSLVAPYPRARYRKDRDLVLSCLRDVQLPQPEQALGRYPHQFSGGQRQRLMIAMAMLPSPDLVIADEPTTALDVTIQAQILKLLRRLVKERGVSVLFTTHDLGTANEICDRIVVMYAGQEVESAPTREFFTRPSHPYTEKLLESLPNPNGEIRDIPGEIPKLLDPPAGCRFHPRCARATAECRQAAPPVTTLGARHWVRCYHPVEHSPERPLAQPHGGRP